jgi:cell shape-determining protein MreC
VRRKWLALWSAFVLGLIAIELFIVTVVIDPLTNFYFVILAIAVIGILAIIGAVFLGIFVTTRILSSQEFTPFEKEMLAMREDVKALTAKVEELTQGISENPREKE